jgi:hypothetical protein
MTAGSFGISADMAVNFVSDSEGTQLNYKAVSEVVSCFRKGKKLDKSWKEEIEKDYIKRG